MKLKEIPVFCYWDGKIISDDNGVSYDSFPKTAVKVRRGIKFQELSNLIYQTMGIDKQNFKLKMMCRYPTTVQSSAVKYTLLPITNDGNVGIMLDIVLLYSEFRNVDLYIETEASTNQEIHERREHFSSQTISNTIEGNEEAFLTNTMSVNDEVNDDSDDNNMEEEIDGGGGNDNNMEEEFHAGGANYNNTEEETDGGGGNEMQDDNNTGVAPCHEEPSPSLPSTITQWNHNGELRKGLIFESKKDLQRAVKLYSIKERRQYVVVKSTTTLWIIKCKMEIECGCTWKLRATKLKRHGYFEVTLFKAPHTCVPPNVSQDHPQLDAKLISTEVEDIVKEQPSIAIMALKKLIIEKYNYNVSYHKLWSAKQKVLQNIFNGSNGPCMELPTIYHDPSLKRSRGRPKSIYPLNGMNSKEGRSKKYCGLCLQTGHQKGTCPNK